MFENDIINYKLEVDFMFRTSRRTFQIAYYLSSVLPVYLLLLIFMISIKIETLGFSWVPRYKNLNGYKIAFILCTICTVISFISLVKVKSIIKNIQDHSRSFGKFKVKITQRYNAGFREFILSFILPMISTFSITDYPCTTIVMILLFQLAIFFFYMNSSDFFPNISLILFGFSVFQVTSEDNSSIKYVFGKTKDIDKLIQSKQEILAVKIGSTGFPSNIAVVL